MDNPHLHIRRILQHPVIRVDRNMTRAAKGVDDILRVGAHHIHAFHFRLAFGLDPQLDRHIEEIEVLADLPDGAEALVVAQPVDGVLIDELRRAGSIQPLRKEGRELLLRLLLGNLFHVPGADGFVAVLRDQWPAASC